MLRSQFFVERKFQFYRVPFCTRARKSVEKGALFEVAVTLFRVVVKPVERSGATCLSKKYNLQLISRILRLI